MELQTISVVSYTWSTCGIY